MQLVLPGQGSGGSRKCEKGLPMSSRPQAIRVENLGKCYQVYSNPKDRVRQAFMPKLRAFGGFAARQYCREFWALRGVSLEVAEGETVGIIGRNGSGKSTLLQMICGTLQPTEGLVETQGRVAALLELGAGFNPEFTGRENVFMNASILGLEDREIKDRFDDIAAFADIGEFINEPVKHYSSGMYARLAFAVAINVDPRILIVDEALAVGDEPFQRKCYAKMEDIKKNGGSILLVSHSALSVNALCDRAILLHQGRCLFSGSPKITVGWYQKLVNAPSEKLESLIGEIEQQRRRTEANSHLENSKVSIDNSLDDDEGGGESSLIAGYDPTLISESQVVYEPRGAKISRAALLDLEGNPVNQLVRGERYQINYQVRFSDSFKNVRLNSMIKTVTGQEIGGGTYPNRKMVGVGFKAGEVAEIAFDFDCNLASGTYFLNCGVSDAGQTLHRILDALIFRVFSDNDTNFNGTVDFKIQSTLSKPNHF